MGKHRRKEDRKKPLRGNGNTGEVSSAQVSPPRKSGGRSKGTLNCCIDDKSPEIPGIAWCAGGWG